IHMLEPRRDIFHLAGFLRRAHDPAGTLGDLCHLLGSHNDPHQAANLAVDEPVLGVAAAARLDYHRAVFLIGLFHVVPSALALDHMGVGIDSWHGNYLRSLLPASSSPL